MGEKGARSLSEALKVNAALTALYLSSEQQQEDHRKQGTISTAMNKAGNWLNEEEARSLSEALKANTTLKELDLGCEQQGNTEQAQKHQFQRQSRQQDGW